MQKLFLDLSIPFSSSCFLYRKYNKSLLKIQLKHSIKNGKKKIKKYPV